MRESAAVCGSHKTLEMYKHNNLTSIMCYPYANQSNAYETVMAGLSRSGSSNPGTGWWSGLRSRFGQKLLGFRVATLGRANN